MSQLSMFSVEELPVSPTPSPDSEADWMTRVATSCSPLLQLLADIAPAGWSGRTCPVSFPAQAEPTLHAFWEFSQDGQSPSPSEAGGSLASFRGSLALTALHGECSTLNISEFPSDAVVCGLSDILETGGVPPQYFLSARACAGILRRAENRRKDLPVALHAALEAVAGPDWRSLELSPEEVEGEEDSPSTTSLSSEP